MAAIDLSAVTARPTGYTVSLDTLWQEIILPEWVSVVTLVPEIAVFVGFDSMGAGAETPADNGAVGTHRDAIPANMVVEIPIRCGPSSGHETDSIFVAAQSGTGSCTVHLDAAKG